MKARVIILWLFFSLLLIHLEYQVSYNSSNIYIVLEKIEKVWINTGTGEDNFIVIHENIIYKLRAKDLDFNEVKYDIFVEI